VFQEPKTDAGARVVVLPDRVRAEIGAHLADFVADDPEALLFATARSETSPARRVGRGSGINPAPPPAFRSSDFMTSGTLRAR
jgi:hypothetical protein